jgi:hypothetical protein
MEKKKFKGNSNKPNGNHKRGALRSANRAFMIKMKVKTKQFRRERTKQPPGFPQGIHVDKKAGVVCQCGGCYGQSD